jgi:hypothetical protein
MSNPPTIFNRHDVLTIITNAIGAEFSVDPAQLDASVELLDLPGASSIKVIRAISRIEAQCDIELLVTGKTRYATIESYLGEVIGELGPRYQP